MPIGGINRAAPAAAQVRNNSQPAVKPQGLQELQLSQCCITALKTAVNGGGAMHNLLGVTILQGTKVRIDWNAESNQHTRFVAGRTVTGTAISAVFNDHAKAHPGPQTFWATVARVKAGRVNQGDHFG